LLVITPVFVKVLNILPTVNRLLLLKDPELSISVLEVLKAPLFSIVPVLVIVPLVTSKLALFSKIPSIVSFGKVVAPLKASIEPLFTSVSPVCIRASPNIITVSLAINS